MKKIEKERGSVYCGNAIWTNLQQRIDQLAPSKIFILTDTNTKKYCLPLLHQHLSVAIETVHITIPAGESNKTIATCQNVWNELTQFGADRDSLLLNLGGGVVTDLGGFVACTFKRGIEFINIPTSLLAMVDASVGGKNGVDLGHLKNQIGVIQNPLAVYVAVPFLESLPEEHVLSGYAEMLKHGLIASEAYWDALNDFDVANAETTEAYIWKSIEIKNEVVTNDPTEKKQRKTLNYGHTLGHAIESYCLENTNKELLLHGEAIAIGMILANYISATLLHFPNRKLQATTHRILEHFAKYDFTENDIEEIIGLLKFDKKNTRGNINFVLLEDFENYKIDQQVSNDVILKAFEYYKNFKI